jgi:hypothetical protein
MKPTLKSVIPNFALMLAIALVGNRISGWLITVPGEGQAPAPLTVQAVSITPLGAARQPAPGTQDAPSPAGSGIAAGARFSYQGRLLEASIPATGQYDFVFTLWDAPSGGTRFGPASSADNQPVSAGWFAVAVDFGADVFYREPRWVQIAVRATGGGSYTTLSPRQPLTATSRMTTPGTMPPLAAAGRGRGGMLA